MNSNNPTTRLLNFSGWIAGSAMAVYGLIFLFLAVRHIAYPAFTEPMEGDILQHIERAAKGLELYPALKGDFLPLSYMPFYYFASAPFYMLFGDTLAAPRMLSAICALLSGLLLFGIAWKESRSRMVGAMAGAMFFAGYRIMDSYLICALPDSLLLLLVLTGFSFQAYGRSKLHDALWLLAFTLAFWTKQHGAFYFGFAVLYALFLRKNALGKPAIVIAFLIGGPISYIVLGRFLGDGFFLHTLSIPGQWPRAIKYAVQRDIFVVTCLVPFAAYASYFYFRSAVSWSRRTITPLAWFILTAFATTTFTMMAAGASNNHYIPFMATLMCAAALGGHSLFTNDASKLHRLMLPALLFFSALMTAVTLWWGHPASLAAPISAAVVFTAFLLSARMETPNRAVLMATALIAGQLGTSFYLPSDSLPIPGVEAAQSSLEQLVKESGGNIIVAPYGNLPTSLTGMKIRKAPSWVALEDVERQSDTAKGLAGIQPFLNQVRASAGLAVLTDSLIEDIPGGHFLASDFVLEKDLGTQFSALRQIAYHWYGGGSYPRYLYRLKPHGTALASALR